MEDTIKDTVLKTFADFYAKGDFPNAWVELEKVRGAVSPGLWHYNAGTVKAQMSNPAEARYHFLKSRAEGYKGDNLETNLSLMEEKLETKSVEKPLETSDYAVKFGMWAQNGFFTTISLIILVSGLMVLKREKKISILVVTILLMIVPVGAGMWIRNWNEVINLQPLEVREGPSAIFASRGELPAGVLLIANKSGEWYQIKYPSRFRGWIKADGIKELE